MADVRKVLGQLAPAATTDSTLYTVGAGLGAIISSITVCNRDPAAATFRVAIRPAGAGLAALHYLYYDAPLAGNGTFIATVGLTLAATAVVTVRASTANLTFGLYGVEDV